MPNRITNASTHAWCASHAKSMDWKSRHCFMNRLFFHRPRIYHLTMNLLATDEHLYGQSTAFVPTPGSVIALPDKVRKAHLKTDGYRQTTMHDFFVRKTTIPRADVVIRQATIHEFFIRQ